jgi:hypothetical protein
MINDIPQSLVNSSDCPLHYHSIDRVPTHDTITLLQSLINNTYINTTTYTVTNNDDYLIATIGSTITLPNAKNGRELVFIKTVAAGSMVINAVGTDLINGASSLTKTAQWSVVKLKAIPSIGWIVL